MTDKKSGKTVNRRTFLKSAAIGASTLTLSGLTAEALQVGETPEKWDLEVDVLIVGAGGAGLVSAIEAAGKGASVAILEKAPVVGGTTAISGGVIQAADTEVQKKSGITDDTTQAHYQYWIQSSEGIADAELVKLLAESTPENMRWLTAQGMVFASVYGVSPIPYIDSAFMKDRIHMAVSGGETPKPGNGGTYVKALYKAAKKAGVKIVLEAPVEMLIYKNGVGVIGAKAEKNGKNLYAKAKRSVILTSGGYDHNKEIAKAFSPQQLWALESGTCLSAPTNTGDGMKMAMALGADLAGMGGTIGVASYFVGTAPFHPSIPAVPGIWVNRYGRRFVNEDTHYAYLMRAAFQQEQQIVWAIFDENTRKMGGKLIGSFWTPLSDDLKKEIADETVKSGNDPEELAKNIGIDPMQLNSTIEEWNADVAAGKDTVFHKTYGLKPIAKGPFYAVNITEQNLGACGGIKIDTETRVIDVNGKAVPRLFASGMVTGGFIGPYYPGSGTAIAALVCFGRIAGKNAANEKPWM